MEEGRDIGDNDNERSHPHDGDNTIEAGYIGVDGDNERENGDSITDCGQRRIGETTSGAAVIV